MHRLVPAPRPARSNNKFGGSVHVDGSDRLPTKRSNIRDDGCCSIYGKSYLAILHLSGSEWNNVVEHRGSSESDGDVETVSEFWLLTCFPSLDA